MSDTMLNRFGLLKNENSIIRKSLIQIMLININKLTVKYLCRIIFFIEESLSHGRRKHKMNISDIRKDFNSKIYADTVRYQRQYGFKIGTGEHATWNNEADAFKHAYMQAWLALNWNKTVSAGIGYFHELENRETVHGELNMDLWNNAIGREIGEGIKKVWGKGLYKLSDEYVEDMIAQRVVTKMQQGELITNPSDPRRFENMKYERIKPDDKVFYKGEYDSLDEELQKNFLKQYSKQLVNNNWQIKERADLDKQVKSGDLICVENYTKADGTKVSGYYRRKPKR